MIIAIKISQPRRSGTQTAIAAASKATAVAKAIVATKATHRSTELLWETLVILIVICLLLETSIVSSLVNAFTAHHSIENTVSVTNPRISTVVREGVLC